MARIESSGPFTSEIHPWILKNQQQISGHSAWYGVMTEEESEKLLSNAPPYSFILCGRNEEHSYSISFVKKDGSIKHQSFRLEQDRKGWLYKNGAAEGLLEAVAKDVEDLIPLMMHCELRACIPFK